MSAWNAQDAGRRTQDAVKLETPFSLTFFLKRFAFVSGRHFPSSASFWALLGAAFLSLFSLSAYAQDVSTYAALQTATSSLTGANTVRLTADITNGASQLTIGRNLTLDLNGRNLTIDLPGTTGQNSNGIKINNGFKLTIVDSNPGANNALTVTNRSGNPSTGNCAAINTSDGTLEIASGRVNANGGYNGAGIGGGSGHAGGKIIISGGTISATCDSYSAAGIGGSRGGAGGNITITGGTVIANGGRGGAGIGGGENGAGGTITITGGDVTATGGDGMADPRIGYGGGAGIGGGGSSFLHLLGTASGIDSGPSGTITLLGNAKVTARGGNISGSQSGSGGGAGIGSGGSAGSLALAGPAGNAANPIIIEGTVTYSATGGTGSNGRNGASIGRGGENNGPGTEAAFNSVTVIQNTGGRISPSSLKASAGSNVAFEIKPDDGNVIASVLVNGTNVPAAVSSGGYTFRNVTGNGTNRIEATFSKFITTAAIVVTAPVADMSPNTQVERCGTGFGCSAVTWTPRVPANNLFVGNTAYTATVKLTANDGLLFDARFVASINNQTANVELGPDGKTATLSYAFPETATPIRIVAIALTAPVTDMSPDTHVARCGTGFGCGTVSWAPAGNFFLPNTAYTATVRLTANNGHTFKGLSEATINGVSATVESNDGNAVTLSHRFPETAAEASFEIVIPYDTPSNNVSSGGGCNTTGSPFGWVAFVAFAAFMGVRRKS